MRPSPLQFFPPYDLYFTIEDLAVISYLQKKFHTLYFSMSHLASKEYQPLL